MKSINDVEKEIIAEFQHLPDVDAKYAYLFTLGDQLPPMSPDLKTDHHLVKGCQSKLWFHLEDNEGRIHVEADSDSLVIKGIAALLIRIIQGRKREELATISMDFIDDLKIWKLASERNSGLQAMLDHIHRASQA
jgi:cysteine desulfuration protein SufE